MFVIGLLFFAVPVALIALVIMGLATNRLRLLRAGMGFRWLVLPTLGLAAGGTIFALTIEELVVRPIELQEELVDRQIVTPLSLRRYFVWGFLMDPGSQWEYAIDAAAAAQLSRGCRPDPNPRVHWCQVAGRLEQGPGLQNGRSAGIRIEGTTLTLEESFF